MGKEQLPALYNTGQTDVTGQPSNPMSSAHAQQETQRPKVKCASRLHTVGAMKARGHPLMQLGSASDAIGRVTPVWIQSKTYD